MSTLSTAPALTLVFAALEDELSSVAPLGFGRMGFGFRRSLIRVAVYPPAICRPMGLGSAGYSVWAEIQ